MTEQQTTWRRASRCADGACVEVARAEEGGVLVRHSNDPGRYLRFTAAEWEAFVAGAKVGEFTWTS